MIGDVKTRATLEGEVNAKTTLEGEIDAKATLSGDIYSRCIIGEVTIGTVTIERYDTEEYDGDYIVTPSSEVQTLETANKLLSSDLEIQAIPYYDVSNEYGRTIYIGGEI